MKLRTFLYLMLLVGIIGGTIFVLYLWRDDAPWLLVGCSALIPFVCGLLLFVNRKVEIDEVSRDIRGTHNALFVQYTQRERDTAAAHADAIKKHVQREEVLLKECTSLVQGLGVLAEIVHKQRNLDYAFLGTIRREALCLALHALDHGVPAATLLSAVTPDTIWDIIARRADNGAIDVVNGPDWHREVMQFFMQKYKDIEVAAPSDTSSS